ncbi:hypothetical protein CBR_g29923 [Chara braunii]|uniref:Probable acetate kinase n=1 Tax=Chara braunii TaxID=69332 RepID=A0A388JX09_CHABU|nr:hypothetical protein CBR_g29923 [Chara braunii]|eukprot:GBG62315.1 hypothetical protein CBR_g29923 [Chara braunii]
MTRSILVLNAGSSSLKYALYHLGAKTRCAVQGLVEQVGTTRSVITHSELGESDDKNTLTENAAIPDHGDALKRVVRLLKLDKQNIAGVGHRVVHGGESITGPMLIDDSLKKAIVRSTPLAPLHNPPNLQGILVAEQLFSCPQVAVFDTAFHCTMPPKAYTYGVPYALYEELGLRRYGFHGTSFYYLTGESARLLNKPKNKVNLIIFHLGAGASMAAIRNGESIDTTMGVTPLEGLMMATRSGDIDPAIYKLLSDQKGMSVAEIDTMLNKESGLVGVCGEKDMRRVLDKAGNGDEGAKLALAVFIHRIRKYLGAYYVHLCGKVDALVFSAGIGERSAPIRALVCEGLEELGISIDEKKNNESRKDGREIQKDGSKIKILVVPTDEELSIAQQTLSVIEKLPGDGPGR